MTWSAGCQAIANADCPGGPFQATHLRVASIDSAFPGFQVPSASISAASQQPSLSSPLSAPIPSPQPGQQVNSTPFTLTMPNAPLQTTSTVVCSQSIASTDSSEHPSLSDGSTCILQNDIASVELITTSPTIAFTNKPLSCFTIPITNTSATCDPFFTPLSHTISTNTSTNTVSIPLVMTDVFAPATASSVTLATNTIHGTEFPLDNPDTIVAPPSESTEVCIFIQCHYTLLN
ncbi:unnamed protein product [Protopolystoma xenopodis]|uniref:Uncharacterized protein n=1 Tax=Protopolystoma xenopodis TaxID=117903 RepID=A0A448WJC8_9PLAT|nr:unnamed protein product [Protopolystoma xenopodis]